MMNRVAWQSPVNGKLLLEANVQSVLLWWGSEQRNSYDTTMIPAQETAGVEHQLSRRKLVRCKGLHEHHRGAASCITGSHSAGQLPPAPEHRDMPINYNNAQRRYRLTNGVFDAVTVDGDTNSAQEQHSSCARCTAGSLDGPH
jgi:hypothetical protein